MSDDPVSNDPRRKSIDDFDKKLRQVRGHAPKGRGPEHSGEESSEGRQNAMGTAFRLSTDLVAAVLVGGFIGYMIDKGLGTEPFGLLLFFFLGIAAGIVNVFRTARQMNLDLVRNMSAEDGETENDDNRT